MCFYDDYTPRIAFALGSTRQKMESEGEKAVETEREERTNARESWWDQAGFGSTKTLDRSAWGHYCVLLHSVRDWEPPQGTEDFYF